MLELFTGRARIARTAFRFGYTTRAMDILYDKPDPSKKSKYTGKKKRSHFDVNAPSGFVFLGRISRIVLFPRRSTFWGLLFGYHYVDLLLFSQLPCRF